MCIIKIRGYFSNPPQNVDVCLNLRKGYLIYLIFHDISKIIRMCKQCAPVIIYLRPSHERLGKRLTLWTKSCGSCYDMAWLIKVWSATTMSRVYPRERRGYRQWFPCRATVHKLFYDPTADWFIVHSHCDDSFILHTVNKKLLLNSHFYISLHVRNCLPPPIVRS